MIRKVPSYETKAPENPFCTFEWVKIWHETIGNDWEPYILNVNDEVIAPFARKNNEIIVAGGNDIADYLDIIGFDEAKKKAWPEIIEYLKTDGVTSIHLNNIPENSSTLSFFKSYEKEDTTPVMTLPNAWDEYLKTLNKKSRHEMERKIRKFEREQSDIKIYDSADPVADTELFLNLMKLDERKRKFLTLYMEAFFQKIIKDFQKNIVLTILTIADKSAAAMLAFKYGDIIMGYNSGFNEERFSGAGFYLKAMHIKRAITSGIKTYNFLQGSERYKYELGGKDFFVYRVDAHL